MKKYNSYLLPGPDNTDDIFSVMV